MRKMMLLLLVVGLPGAVLFAQTPIQMLLKMNDAYAKASSYSMAVEMQFFIGNNNVTPLNTFRGEVCKSGAFYYSSIMGKTTVVNKDYTVFVDEGEKLIIYSSNKGIKKHDDPVEIPDTASFGKIVQYSFGKGTETSSRVIVVPSDKTIYKKIELLINKKTFALEEVVYHYAVDKEDEPESAVQQLTVRFSAIQLNSAIPAEKFSESKFITRRKGAFVGTGKYAAFQVIEQDNTLPPNIH